MREKISLFCDVPKDAVIEGLDTQSIYELPLIFEQQGLASIAVKALRLDGMAADHSEWERVVRRIREPQGKVSLAMVGKYMVVQDAYISVVEAMKHGAIENGVAANIKRVNAEEIERDGPEAHLSDVHGILVPGGFGQRGIEGKIQAIRYARERQIPFLGLCLGMQCAVVEFARNRCGLADAHSAEFDPDSPHRVLDLMPDQRGVEQKGATMRLGVSETSVKPGTLAHRVYGADTVFERHRHRYEVVNDYREALERAGMVVSGTTPDGRLVELIELPDHPFFIASQYHPEFRSRPNRAHPLFREFVRAALEHGERP
jgi:CTP synthase